MKHVHFIGIGGIGMSALAHYLLDMGVRVTGSDRHHTKIVQRLCDRGVKIEFLSHDADVAVYSTAIPPDHPELKEATKRGILIWHRSEMLLQIGKDHHIIGVTGAHGKTTTTSLLAHIFTTAGKNPSYILGGLAQNFPYHGKHGEGDIFIAEIDESDGSFESLFLYHLLINSVDLDHVDFWHHRENLLAAYQRLIDRTQKIPCVYDDHRHPHTLHPTQSYGFSENADIIAVDIQPQTQGTTFRVMTKGEDKGIFFLPLLGKHNVHNALGAIALSLDEGISTATIREACQTFLGVKRRMEVLGKKNQVTIISDYAHHPEEVAAILQICKDYFSAPLIVFEPHRIRRLQRFIEDFIEIFRKGPALIVTSSYLCREEQEEQKLLDRLCEQTNACFVHSDDLLSYLEKQKDAISHIIFLGAGHAHTYAEKFYQSRE